MELYWLGMLLGFIIASVIWNFVIHVYLKHRGRMSGEKLYYLYVQHFKNDKAYSVWTALSRADRNRWNTIIKELKEVTK